MAEKESPSVGALLAMGVRRKDIYPMLLVPFAAARLIGGPAGYVLSRIFDMDEVAGGQGYYSIPEVPMISHPLILLCCVLMAPLVCTLINLLLMQKNLRGCAPHRDHYGDAWCFSPSICSGT